MSEQDQNLESGEYISTERLVAAREALGLSQESIQRELRLTTNVMLALEAGDVKGMGQPVFARGYLRSYGRRVGVDADDLVAQYDAAIGQALPKRSRIREMTSSSVPATASMRIADQKRKPSGVLPFIAKLAGAVLVIVALGYALTSLNVDLSNFNLSSIFKGDDEAAETNPNQLIIPGQSSGLDISVPLTIDAEPEAVAQEPSIESVIESQPEIVTSSDPVDIQTEVVTSLPSTDSQEQSEETPVSEDPPVNDAAASVDSPESSLPVVASVPVLPTSQPAQESQPTAQVVPQSSDGVARTSITFADVSWVNIKDGRGGALFNGLAERGRTLELSGQPPINFVIGRADAVSSLTFNGVTVDLDSYTRKNVARLTLP